MHKIYIYNSTNKLEISDCVDYSLEEIKSIPDNSVDICFIQDLLDTVLPTDHNSILKEIGDKLSPQGIINIQAADIKQIAIALTYGNITTELAQMILYKDKIFTHTANNIKDLLLENNFKIISQKYINIFEYHFSCMKNI